MIQVKIVGTKRIWKGEVSLFGDDKDSRSFEDYLLETEVGWFQRLLARLGQEVFIGDFKPEKHDCDFEHYFLFWCSVHRKYIVSYLRGDERRLDCPLCYSEFLFDIKKNMSNDESGKNERKLKLVKSDRGLKS